MNTSPTGTSRVRLLPVRMLKFCCALRTTMSVAPPSIAVCTNRPRCERESGGRSQSRKPTTTRNRAVPPMTMAAFRQVSLMPRTARMK